MVVAFAGFGLLVGTTLQVEVSGSRETALFTPFGIAAIVLMVVGVLLSQRPRR